MQTDVPECLHCGACCFSQLTNYVRVTGTDHARLGECAEDLVTFDGTRAYMRMVDGHCAALAIHPNGHWACTTYETRPQVCRDLARASVECAGEIAEKGERPLVALGGVPRC